MKIQKLITFVALAALMMSCASKKEVEDAYNNTREILKAQKDQKSPEVRQADPEMIKRYREQANNGDPRAMLELGVLYAYGQGFPKDYAEALRWYRLAADNGQVRAMHNIGYMYDEGLGVQQSYPEARKWYQMAAEKGEIYSMCNLGHLYERV